MSEDMYTSPIKQGIQLGNYFLQMRDAGGRGNETQTCDRDLLDVVVEVLVRSVEEFLGGDHVLLVSRLLLVAPPLPHGLVVPGPALRHGPDPVTQDGHSLKPASVELKANLGVVLAAVTQDGRALRFASAELKSNLGVVLAAVTQDGRALVAMSITSALALSSTESHTEAYRSAFPSFITAASTTSGLALGSAEANQGPPTPTAAMTGVLVQACRRWGQKTQRHHHHHHLPASRATTTRRTWRRGWGCWGRAARLAL